jgi:hypothetical protein
VSTVLRADTAEPVSGSATASAPAPLLRAVLTGYAWAVLVPLLGLVALLSSWMVTSMTGWMPALALLAAWAAGSVAWLYWRAWPRTLVHLVTWAAPAALLTPLAALGWLSADGLVLWGPVTSVLAVCVVVIQRPRPAATDPAEGR